MVIVLVIDITIVDVWQPSHLKLHCNNNWVTVVILNCVFILGVFHSSLDCEAVSLSLWIWGMPDSPIATLLGLFNSLQRWEMPSLRVHGATNYTARCNGPPCSMPWRQSHKELKSPKLKSRANHFCSNFDYNVLIMSKFCTCHDSWAVVPYAKLWHDLMTVLLNRAIYYCAKFGLWIHKPFVKWILVVGQFH